MSTKLILGHAVLALAIFAGWQIASCALANLEIHEDLRDLAAQGGARIGLGNFSTDEENKRTLGCLRLVPRMQYLACILGQAASDVFNR